MGRISVVVLALAVAAGLAAPPSAAESGRGTVGAWDVLWRYSETEGYQNRFRDSVPIDVPFPIAWRRLTGVGGDRLAFYDVDGNLMEEHALAPGESAAACDDGSCYLVWAPRADSRSEHEFRFYRRGEPGALWEASAPGEPVLFAPDGSLFVIAARDPKRDRFRRITAEGDGELQVVGASGEVRGELPIYPAFCALTGDQRRLVFLHEHEAIALGRDGRLDWKQDLPVDALVLRTGVPQLATGRGIVVLCGTGEGEGEPGLALHQAREGTLRAYDDAGRLRWSHRQPKDDDLWFQISVAVSPDGGTVVTCHSEANVLLLRAWDGATGERLWEQRVARAAGFRSLSVAPGGRAIVLAQCDNRTTVRAWDREGTPVWDGIVPHPSRCAVLRGDDLLVAEQWVARLSYPDSP